MPESSPLRLPRLLASIEREKGFVIAPEAVALGLVIVIGAATGTKLIVESQPLSGSIALFIPRKSNYSSQLKNDFISDGGTTTAVSIIHTLCVIGA